MTSQEAAQILDLAVDASSDQIEARFFELRARLEEKTSKAPTPGLKEKYRAALTTVTEAFETLTLAADSTTLPVRLRSEPVAKTAPVATPVANTAAEPARTEVPKPSFGSVALMHFTGCVKFCISQVFVTMVIAVIWGYLIDASEDYEMYLPVAASAVVGFISAVFVWRRSVRRARRRVAEGKRNTLDNGLAIAFVALAVAFVAVIVAYNILSRARSTERQADLASQYIRESRADVDRLFDQALKAEAEAETALSALRAQERSLAANPENREENALRDARALVRAQERYVRWLGNTLPGHPARRDRINLDDALTRLNADRRSTQPTENANKAFESYSNSTDSLHWEIENRKPDPVFVTNIAQWREAAERDEAWAMWNLHLAFLDGKGAVEPDLDTSVAWLRRAANKGDSMAVNRMAYCLWYGMSKAGTLLMEQNRAEAIEWYRKGAEAGDANCMMNLGARLRKGDHIATDAVAAAEWFRKAAEGGNTLAMLYLGECYANGEGVAANEQTAIEWWTKAAKLDQYGAQDALRKRNITW